MAHGGKRPGSGPEVKIAGTRKWFRDIVENPDLRSRVEKIIQAEVAQGQLENWWKAVEHGFGRPPQALDIRTPPGQGPLVYLVAHEGDAAATAATGLPDPTEAQDVSSRDVAVGGED